MTFMIHERGDKSRLSGRVLQDCNTTQKKTMKTKKFWDGMTIEHNDITIILLNYMCCIRSFDCKLAQAPPINTIVWYLSGITG